MVSSRSEAPMPHTGPGSASPRSRPDTWRCYHTCMSQTSESERRGMGGRRGRGREIRIPTYANFWYASRGAARCHDPPPSPSLTCVSLPPAGSLFLVLRARKSPSTAQIVHAAMPHPTNMLDPTRASTRARPAGLAQDATDDYEQRDSSSAAASPRQPEIDLRCAALRPLRLRADVQRNASRGRLTLRPLCSLILPRLIPLSDWAQGTQMPT